MAPKTAAAVAAQAVAIARGAPQDEAAAARLAAAVQLLLSSVFQTVTNVVMTLMLRTPVSDADQHAEMPRRQRRARRALPALGSVVDSDSIDDEAEARLAGSKRRRVRAVQSSTVMTLLPLLMRMAATVPMMMLMASLMTSPTLTMALVSATMVTMPFSSRLRRSLST